MRPFFRLMGEGQSRVRVRLTGFCLMANHFHLLLLPRAAGALSRWMQWLLTAHVRRYFRHDPVSGRAWRCRLKAFPFQKYDQYLAALRYIERNPLRASLADRSEDWKWSSLRPTVQSGPEGLLCDDPLAKRKRLTGWVNGVVSESEMKEPRRTQKRGTPVGDRGWQRSPSRRLAPDGQPSKIRTMFVPTQPLRVRHEKAECPLFASPKIKQTTLLFSESR